jgi:hypothetical protein
MTTTVTLGPYTLQSFEIPAAITFGGRQRMAVHDLPGGGRVIDVLGSADNDIAFAGIISGENADTKAQLLDALRISGTAVSLCWSDQYFIVIIAELNFDFRKSWWIPYQLRCTVVSNLVYGVAATAISTAVSIAADLASASGLLASTPINLSAAQTALSATGATTLGTSAYGQSLSALSAGQTSLSDAMTTAGSSLPSFDLSLASHDPTAMAASLSAATSNSGQLASLSAAQGFVGRSLSTLSNIGS